jgi:hypothetical protein
MPKLQQSWARIWKRLRSPRIDFKESIPQAHVPWRLESIPGLLKRFQILGQASSNTMESGATDETVLNKVLKSSKKIHLVVIDMNMEYDQKKN